MRVGVLGSGWMGGELGAIFARAGHEVVFSFAQSHEKLKKPVGVPTEESTFPSASSPSHASAGSWASAALWVHCHRPFVTSAERRWPSWRARSTIWPR